MEIRDFSSDRREDFARLNLEWIERWFTVDHHDLLVLHDPEGQILQPGGRIWFAVDTAGTSVGTVALRSAGDGAYELSKMAVSPELRGSGVGRLLGEAVIAGFSELGGSHLYLETNSGLGPAIALYESLGFEHRPPRGDSPYERADVHMVWIGHPTDGPALVRE